VQGTYVPVKVPLRADDAMSSGRARPIDSSNRRSAAIRQISRERLPQRIRTYIAGVGNAMRRHSPAFYDDMVSYETTARIYRRNSETAARRVHEMIDDAWRRARSET
jgi:hypothetical protein